MQMSIVIGEGLVDTFVVASGGGLLEFDVTDPLEEFMTATMDLIGNGQTAATEMARARGLVLMPENKCNPLVTTTFGTGEVKKKALDLGCTRLTIDIGGNATNDGKMGMA